MGDNHPHRGCHGGGTGNLGVCRIADMAGARIMSPLNYPVHHSGCVRMKRSLLAHRLLNPLGFVVFKMGALPKLSRNPPKRKDWPDWPWRGGRLRLPEASPTPPGAASSAPPSFSSENGFSAKSRSKLAVQF
jgi:hypothetical protein